MKQAAEPVKKAVEPVKRAAEPVRAAAVPIKAAAKSAVQVSGLESRLVPNIALANRPFFVLSLLHTHDLW